MSIGFCWLFCYLVFHFDKIMWIFTFTYYFLLLVSFVRIQSFLDRRFFLVAGGAFFFSFAPLLLLLVLLAGACRNRSWRMMANATIAMFIKNNVKQITQKFWTPTDKYSNHIETETDKIDRTTCALTATQCFDKPKWKKEKEMCKQKWSINNYIEFSRHEINAHTLITFSSLPKNCTGIWSVANY